MWRLPNTFSTPPTTLASPSFAALAVRLRPEAIAGVQPNIHICLKEQTNVTERQSQAQARLFHSAVLLPPVPECCNTHNTSRVVLQPHCALSASIALTACQFLKRPYICLFVQRKSLPGPEAQLPVPHSPRVLDICNPFLHSLLSIQQL